MLAAVAAAVVVVVRLRFPHLSSGAAPSSESSAESH